MLATFQAKIAAMYRWVLLQLDKPQIGGPIATFGLALSLVMGLSAIYLGTPYQPYNFLLVAGLTAGLGLLGRRIAIYFCPAHLLAGRLAVSDRMLIQAQRFL